MLNNVKKLIFACLETRAFPCLAKVEKTYTQADKYCVECRELRPNGEETKTIYMDVLVPKLIGASDGGVWLTPAEGTIVLLNFLGGDRNWPVIAAVVGGKSQEFHPEDELIIKLGQTEMRLSDKVVLKNAQGSLGDILSEMADLSTQLKTLGAPSPHTLNPELIIKWELLKNQKIDALFKE